VGLVAAAHKGTPVVRSRWLRIGAAAGVAGPVAFTLAWVMGSLRQPGLSFSAAQISGLAADNATDPWLMIGGFVALGGCAVGFGTVLATSLGGSRAAGPGPALIAAAGAFAIAAGLLRRDHVLLSPGPESWHNHAHDVVSAVSYVLLVTGPLFLAWRLRRDSRWRPLAVPLASAAVAAAGLLVAFYAGPHDSWDGTLQRIAVSLPLAAVAAVAVRLAQLGPTQRGEPRATPSVAPSTPALPAASGPAELDQKLEQSVVLRGDEAGEARVGDVPVGEHDRDGP
jgi:hypothetical membrane protein